MPETTQTLGSVSRGTFERCPKCDLRPATPAGNHWCNECRAAYQREYQETKITMAKNKGFYEGVKATREWFAERFETYSTSFTGKEIAQILRNPDAPGPKADEDEQKPQTP